MLCRVSNALSPGYEGHNYAYVTPIVGQWALLGETGKYVPLSSARITGVAIDEKTGSLEVALVGAEGESVEFCAWDVRGHKALCLEVAFGATGGEQRVAFASPA